MESQGCVRSHFAACWLCFANTQTAVAQNYAAANYLSRFRGAGDLSLPQALRKSQEGRLRGIAAIKRFGCNDYL